MKKSIVAFGFVALMSTGIVPTTLTNLSNPIVYAASTINFDQGSMSDEDYVKSVIDQFTKQDSIKLEYTSNDEENPMNAVAIIDLKNKKQKMTSELAGLKSETYLYNDGTVADSTSTVLEMAKSINPENKEAMDEIIKTLEGKYITQDYPDAKGQIDNIIKNNITINETFDSFENKDGKVVASSSIIPISEAPDGETLAQLYPKDTTYQTIVTVDPKAQTVTFETIIDVNEDSISSEESDDDISLSAFLKDNHNTMIMSTTDETVPSLDQLETTTKDEVNKLFEDKGLTPVL